MMEILSAFFFVLSVFGELAFMSPDLINDTPDTHAGTGLCIVTDITAIDTYTPMVSSSIIISKCKLHYKTLLQT